VTPRAGHWDGVRALRRIASVSGAAHDLPVLVSVLVLASLTILGASLLANCPGGDPYGYVSIRSKCYALSRPGAIVDRAARGPPAPGSNLESDVVRIPHETRARIGKSKPGEIGICSGADHGHLSCIVQTRRALHLRVPKTHDWASIVLFFTDRLPETWLLVSQARFCRRN
jgi:hypothetical protein